VERYVELGRPAGRMRGMLHLPDRPAFRPPWPGVVLYHGFTGGRTEARFLFVHFSRLLARHGIASVRFDFIGSGESDGEFQDMTLSGEIADGRAILDWFRGVRGVDSRRLFLLGLSAGGTIAGYVAGERGEEVCGLVLWAPAGEISERIREREEYLRAAAATSAAASAGPAPDPMDYGGLRAGPRYASDAMTVRVLEQSARFSGPVLVAYGTSDPVIPPAVACRYGELYGARARLVAIQGAGHVFEGYRWREELYRLSLQFIRENARS
jgi:pimeloyl-ACP methyl ester carboxylesterase